MFSTYWCLSISLTGLSEEMMSFKSYVIYPSVMFTNFAFANSQCLLNKNKALMNGNFMSICSRHTHTCLWSPVRPAQAVLECCPMSLALYLILKWEPLIVFSNSLLVWLPDDLQGLELELGLKLVVLNSAAGPASSGCSLSSCKFFLCCNVPE